MWPGRYTTAGAGAGFGGAGSGAAGFTTTGGCGFGGGCGAAGFTTTGGCGFGGCCGAGFTTTAGCGFGGGIDNMDLGFSDEGMASFDQVNDDFGDFGSELDGDSVNAMSEIEPGSPDTETEPLDNGGSDEGPAEDFDLGGSDDLAEL